MARIEVKRVQWTTLGQKQVAYVGRIFSESRKMVIYETKYCRSRVIAKAQATHVFHKVAEPACRIYTGQTTVILPFHKAVGMLKQGKLSNKITMKTLKERRFLDVFKQSREIRA